jgi:dethiobiotin synthetase
LGKTFVSYALLAWAKNQGLRCGYVKPVQAGSIDLNSHEASGDAEWIAAKLGKTLPVNTLFRLTQPYSPHWAAEKDGVEIDPQRLIEGVNTLAKDKDFLLVEGAGGLAAPLNHHGLTLAEIAHWQKWNPLLVAAPGLGTLSHTRTAYAFGLQLGLRIRAFLFSRTRVENESPEALAMEKENARLISHLTGMDFLGSLPFRQPQGQFQRQPIGQLQGQPQKQAQGEEPLTQNSDLEKAPWNPALALGFQRFWDSLQ